MNDDRLALSVTHPDGSISRWGGDEPDAEDIPVDLRFSTSVPGGFRDLTCSLLRRFDKTYTDQGLFDNVRLYAPGNQTIWEGRMKGFPRSHGASFNITPQAVGWVAHLKDDPSFSIIYADRDLGWGSMSGTRRQALIAQPRTVYDGTVRPDTTNQAPSLVIGPTGVWGDVAHAESWYDAGPGNQIGAIYYAFSTTSNISASDPNWTWQIYVASDDTAAGAITSGDLSSGSTGSGYYTPASAKRYAWVQVEHAVGGSGSNNAAYEVSWRPVVYGDHGLTRRGSDPGGLYASDVIAHALSQAAPMLTYTTGANGSIQPTSFPIPHLVFRDPTTVDAVIERVNGFHLWEWGVYDDREFFFRPPDPDRLTWRVRKDEGVHMDADGLSDDRVFNGAFVIYTDPAGKRHTVGPPGSRAEATNTSLVDTSDSNPVNQHGIPRRWAKLEISNTTTQAGAIQLGAVFLAEFGLNPRRGSMRVTGTATHPTKGPRPVAEIRAGDFVMVEDIDDSTPRRIIETDCAPATRTNTLTLDNTADKLPAIIERMGVNLIGIV